MFLTVWTTCCIIFHAVISSQRHLGHSLSEPLGCRASRSRLRLSALGLVGIVFIQHQHFFYLSYRDYLASGSLASGIGGLKGPGLRLY